MSTSLSITFRGRVEILWTIFFPIFMPFSRVHDFYLVGGGGGERERGIMKLGLKVRGEW